jgi:hypothetical protein
MEGEAGVLTRASRADVGEATYLAALVGFAFVLIDRFCFPDAVEHIASILPDDSFFYFQIAWNFPDTHRSATTRSTTRMDSSRCGRPCSPSWPTRARTARRC